MTRHTGPWVFVTTLNPRTLLRQAMREQDLPDVPTFQPLWPLPPAGTPGAEGASMEGQGVRERLEAAAQAIPGAVLTA